MCVWGLLFWVQAACFGPLFSQCIDVSLATDTLILMLDDASDFSPPSPLIIR